MNFVERTHSRIVKEENHHQLKRMTFEILFCRSKIAEL